MSELIYFTTKAADDAADGGEFVLSDDQPDRTGDVISPSAWAPLPAQVPALLNHDRAQVIGKWTDLRVKAGRLTGRLNLVAPGKLPWADWARALLDDGSVETVSIGARPIKKEPIGDKADSFFGPFRFLKMELLETSLVAIPANPRCRRIAKSYGIPDAEIERVLAAPGLMPRRTASGSPARPPTQPHEIRRAIMPGLNLGQKITELEQRIVRLNDDMAAINDDNPTDDDIERQGVLAAEKERAVKNLGFYKSRESGLATGTSLVPVARGSGPGGAGGPPPGAPIIIPARKLEARDYIVRLYAANLLSAITKRSLESVVAERYKDDITPEVIKAAVAPASTTVAGWASELVGVGIGEFLDTLKATSVYPRLAAKGPRFTFGRNGVIKIPARNATPRINGSFVGEGQAIPVRKLGLTSISLTPKKMAVISEFTREMAAHSTPSIESVVRQSMGDDTGEVVDSVLLDTTAADAIRPAGLLAGVAGLTPTAAGALTPLQIIVADLQKLIAAVTANRGGRDLVLIVNSQQALALEWVMTPDGRFAFDSISQSGGNLRSLTVVASANATARRVILVDAADFASATGDSPEFDVSDVATIHEEDTTPLPISAVGAPNVVAAPVRSLWQTASIGVRMILEINWSMRRAGMVAWMDAVNW
jgi:HK97 family phage prohead protease